MLFAGRRRTSWQHCRPLAAFRNDDRRALPAGNCRAGGVLGVNRELSEIGRRAVRNAARRR